MIFQTHQHLQHLLGLWINLHNVFLQSRDLGEGRETTPNEAAPSNGQSYYIRDVVVTSLPLLLLELDGDASHWTLLDAPHQMRHEPTVGCALFRMTRHCPFGFSPGDLVPEPLAGDYGDVLAHALVGVEVVRESSVVLLYDNPRRLLDRLRSHSPLGENETRAHKMKQRLDRYKGASKGHKTSLTIFPSSPRESHVRRKELFARMRGCHGYTRALARVFDMEWGHTAERGGRVVDCPGGGVARARGAFLNAAGGRGNWLVAAETKMFKLVQTVHSGAAQTRHDHRQRRE